MLCMKNYLCEHEAGLLCKRTPTAIHARTPVKHERTLGMNRTLTSRTPCKFNYD